MMDLTSTTALALLGTQLPAAIFGLILVFTRRHARLSAGLSIAAVSVTLLCAVGLLVRHWNPVEPIRFTVRWVASGDIEILFGYFLDPASLLMLTTVAVICFLVQVYSLGYMAGDPGFARYYAYMSLFVWAMTSLTVAPNLLQLYIFWELVGLASYLLIGFWFEKFSASEAGKKAFVMTRTGDVAFFLGLILLLMYVGNLDIATLNQPAAAARMSPAALSVAALLIFGGVVGKSAQFPLLTWLPDAMEGPTPVSALLHSATMVAAGVYLFARLFPFFSASSAAMAVFLVIGTVSMLAASTMAMVSRDIKRVWAYSTISQLGYMIMGLAAGGYFAGVFHLTTHAGFKALLFLCSGVLIHHFESNDMFEIGRAGGRGLKIPMICMIVGGAALAGVPPLSGFFSKEQILGALAGLENPVWLILALVGVFLTAYYTFRLIFVILFPKAATGHPGGSTADEHSAAADRIMDAVLLILAGATLILGFLQSPLQHFITGGPAAVGDHGGHSAALAAVSIGLVAAAVGLAWLEFGRRSAAQVGFVERLPALGRFFEQRWYLDHLYRLLLNRVVYRGLSALCTAGDRKAIDGFIHGVSHETVRSGGRLSLLHSAMIQYRLLVLFAIMVLLGAYIIM